MTAIVKPTNKQRTNKNKIEIKTKLLNIKFFETILISTEGVTTNYMLVLLIMIK